MINGSHVRKEDLYEEVNETQKPIKQTPPEKPKKEKKQALKPKAPKQEEQTEEKKEEKPKRKWFWQRRKEAKAQGYAKKKKKKQQPIQKIPDILPVRDISGEHDKSEAYVLLEDGMMQQYLRLESGDLRAKSDSEINRIIQEMGKNLRTMPGNTKWISMKFPSDLSDQKAYWNRKYKQTTDETRLLFIEQKYRELELLEQQKDDINYYIVIYAENEEDLLKRKHHCINALQSFDITPLTKAKTKSVLYKLNNQNSKVK